MVYQFKTDTHVFYKNERTNELDEVRIAKIYWQQDLMQPRM